MATSRGHASLPAPEPRPTPAPTTRAAAHKALAWTSPRTVRRTLARLLLVVCSVTGCGPIPPLPITLPSRAEQVVVLTQTEVQLAQRNYRVVRTQVVGSSRGVALLGLLTVKPPDAIAAFAHLVHAGGLAEGQARALINVIQHSRTPFFLLFSLPTITFRGDVVEFVDPAALPEPAPPRPSPHE